MLLFSLVCIALNLAAYAAVRRVVPAARTRSFTVTVATLGALAWLPWGAFWALGWSALETVPQWAWLASLAWEVGTITLCIGSLGWMPVSAFLHARSQKPGIDPARRALLTQASMVVPAVTWGTGVAGVANAQRGPVVRNLVLAWPDLPPALHGFRVGQFSDVHVGPFVMPNQVALAVDALNDAGCHLQVMTGDLHDDNALIPDVLVAMKRCRAPYGLTGILGNHEYYAGLQAYLRMVKDGPMRMLIDQHQIITHNGARLYIAGVDYPFGAWGRASVSVHTSMRQALKGRQPGDFTLCLAHHPICFDSARQHGVHLTLSGHTHGGQVVGLGRTLFAPLFKYMLGTYTEGTSQLHVTSGLGHWFPYRLGLPPEVVVVELQRA